MNNTDTHLTIPVRLLTTLIAGLAGYGAAGIAMLFIGTIETWSQVGFVMALFTAVYVAGVFAARRLLKAFLMAALQRFALEGRI